MRAVMRLVSVYAGLTYCQLCVAMVHTHRSMRLVFLHRFYTTHKEIATASMNAVATTEPQAQVGVAFVPLRSSPLQAWHDVNLPSALPAFNT
mmetsp:Transcript_12200/g.30359  ORF Transcript_12200/g.30359 Transcript_12200/m.30359 type:complete len:92 (+) Transcript_12200:289-564(+)